MVDSRIITEQSATLQLSQALEAVPQNPADHEFDRLVSPPQNLLLSHLYSSQTKAKSSPEELLSKKQELP